MAIVLITGKGGKSGSWKIRGEQLGVAIGADVLPEAETLDCKSARVVVCVKRISERLVRTVHASGRPLVWDVVDAYPQPNNWTREQCMDWLHGELRRIQPDAVVWPTRRMMRDAGFAGPQIVLPHHAWTKYGRTQTRDKVRVVGYEGGESYLGKWREIVQRECDKRGWQFQINGDMRDADIGVALRDGNGYAQRHWKPGTKLANLQALGIPALCSQECGYHEIASGSEVWIEEALDVGIAFAAVESACTRQVISEIQSRQVLTLESVADKYKEWLSSLALNY